MKTIISFSLTAVLMLSCNGAFAAKVAVPTEDQEVRIAKLVRITRRVKPSDLPVFEQAVNTADNVWELRVALRGLARIGGDEVLRFLQSAEVKPSNIALRQRIIRTVAARVRTTSMYPRSTHSASTRLNYFLKECGVKPQGINKMIDMKVDIFSETSRQVGISGNEIVALEELADMVYVDKDVALKRAILDIRINADKYVPSKYKLDLCEKNKQERISWIIDYISKRGSVLDDDAYYLIQLVSMEGIDASQAAAQRLTEMRYNRDGIRNPSFKALFCVIVAVGDKERANIIKSFIGDSDNRVSYSAEILYNDIESGKMRNFYKIAF